MLPIIRRHILLPLFCSAFLSNSPHVAAEAIEAANPAEMPAGFFDQNGENAMPLPRFEFPKTQDFPQRPSSALQDMGIGGSKATLLIDQTTLVSASLKMILEAKTSIDIEMYKFENESLINALVKRAADPLVRIRLVLDPLNNPRNLRRLRQAGVAVSFYPTGKLHGSILPIDHVKLMIVDRERAVAGGSNWNTDASISTRRDYNLRLEGAVVQNLLQVFEESWALANGLPLPPRSAPSMDPGDEIQVAITDREDREPLEAILVQIAAAKKTIRAEQFLFNEKRIIRALIAAHQRGVDVRVLLDPNTAFFGGVNIHTAKRLFRNGVAIRFFNDPSGAQNRLHAKMAVFDGETVIIGSANWSRNALRVNHELAFLFRDPTIAGALNEEFDADWNGRSNGIPSYHGLRALLQFVARIIAGQFS